MIPSALEIASVMMISRAGQGRVIPWTSSSDSLRAARIVATIFGAILSQPLFREHKKAPPTRGRALQSSIQKVSCSLLMFPCLYGLALVHYLDGGIPNYLRGTYGESPIA